MLDYANGSSYLNGAIKTGCRTHGWKDDTNHNHVQTHQAQNGGICLLKSLYPIK